MPNIMPTKQRIQMRLTLVSNPDLDIFYNNTESTSSVWKSAAKSPSLMYTESCDFK